MKTYKDLKLKDLGKMLDLDFIYHTYLSTQCSCCYGPNDIPQGWLKEQTDNPKYLLFKNAYNGRGTRKLEDEIEDYTCISHSNLTPDELELISGELSNRLGENYIVLSPKTTSYTIVIRTESKTIKDDENFKVLRYGGK